ncbi:hypothetical protein ACFOY4_09945 [Actinomadura syzygii]|uniref:hypothetical protein n=1 Tax=Actinomadura syzygii TaxID=1427538 RepID=UPI001CA3582F|nr:hypothetical protein [Actinomadura syzygii]
MDLLGRWERFVAECERGYRQDDEDYVNDLTSRMAIERAMRSEELARFPEMAEFRRQVVRIDERFRVLLHPDVFPNLPAEEWWARGMVRYAGHKLVNDLRKRGVTIDLVSEGNDAPDDS